MGSATSHVYNAVRRGHRGIPLRSSGCADSTLRLCNNARRLLVALRDSGNTSVSAVPAYMLWTAETGLCRDTHRLRPLHSPVPYRPDPLPAREGEAEAPVVHAAFLWPFFASGPPPLQLQE